MSNARLVYITVTQCKVYIHSYCYHFMQLTDDPLMVVSQNPPRSSPRFAGFGENNYVLFIDREVLCDATSFSQALMLWFASHYIFHLQYCDKVKEVAYFMQEFVFGVPVDTADYRKSVPFMSVTSDIQKYTCT